MLPRAFAREGAKVVAGELGASGIRAICLRPDTIPEALNTVYTRAVFDGIARRLGTAEMTHVLSVETSE
jgi:hypothetical protein